jgi:signal recognition particle receptor subunit beta
MVVVSYSGKEINAKLVYYGPGLCGKTTNLEHVYDSIPSTHRGKMVSMKTRTERTLFFDFLPVDLGELGGFKTRFLLYTVPGQVYYNATRKLVLRGVDAVVFVADSARGKMNENLESLENLKENLKEYGLDLNTMPWVLQYNKRDLPDTYTIEEMNQALNPNGTIQHFEAVATNGTGVFETLKGVSRLLLEKLSKEIKLSPRIADPGIEAKKAGAATTAASMPVAPAAASPAAPTVSAAPAAAASTKSPGSAGASSTTPMGASATPSTPAGVRASGPAPSSSRPVPSAAPASIALSGSFDAAGSSSSSSGAEPAKGGFGQKLARMFGFGRKPEPFDMTPAATGSGAASGTTASGSPAEPPSAAPAPPRAAVVTSGSSTRISRVDPAPARPASAPSSASPKPAAASAAPIEKRLSVPVSLELTAEELQSGARVRLVLDLDLSTMQATVERESRTGTR